MSDSPESLVRKYLAAWADPKPDELGSFFREDAVWVDGPQGVRRGADAITAEITSQLTAVGGVTVEVKSLLSDGRIAQWREAYDLKFVMDQIEAAVRARHSGKPNS